MKFRYILLISLLVAVSFAAPADESTDVAAEKSDTKTTEKKRDVVAKDSTNYLAFTEDTWSIVAGTLGVLFVIAGLAWGGYYFFYQGLAEGGYPKSVFSSDPYYNSQYNYANQGYNYAANVARSIEGTISGGRWNFTRVLEMIDIAQKTYEGFDWQSLDCQKKVLCELSHKNSDLGETGRKITTSINYYTGVSDKFIDALEGLPIPRVLQYYLKEYKEAITQGKQANKDCAQVYPSCKFSLKELFVNKAVKKSS